ncbi:Uma2 family endonuclease [Merismopedia glauca]|uniref:Putative restriction endonuclease domain-containing protein n=1 Tax=Merismopedia glauca CCAP 1448/3 TaxID=1296344 RepID=A0A2T1C9W2_9CYAN|nr:Uma2 family endonuclease [Merismopedia glauca]PSB05046.1 hypothetical protein C7B64_01410 [Merismopedia glauca CCAP 1448/3]
MTAIVINLPAIAQFNDEQFYQLCQANSDLKLELSAVGELIVMPPTGGITGKRNSDIIADLVIWNRRTGLGVVFDSSTVFKLPNGANRSPDAAWIPLDKWNALTSEQQEKFLPLCPDFVIELRSPSDSLKTLQNKMQEFIDNGTVLGWLINPQARQVEIYHQSREKEVLEHPINVLGENVLPGFVFNLQLIW